MMLELEEKQSIIEDLRLKSEEGQRQLSAAVSELGAFLSMKTSTGGDLVREIQVIQDCVEKMGSENAAYVERIRKLEQKTGSP